MIIDPAEIDHRHCYKLLTGCVVPRPIALVTTLGASGPNAAPFSFFNVAGTDPPTVVIAIGRQADGSEKDTIRNIRASRDFVVHICSEAMAERMNICATDFPPDVNELEQANLSAVPSLRVSPPRIPEAPVQMECRLTQIMELGTHHIHNVVFGEVVMVHCQEGLVDDEFNVDATLLRPIGRLSGPWYTKTSQRFRMERPHYKPASKAVSAPGEPR